MSCNNPGSTTFNITGSSNTANLIFNSEQGVITEGSYENNNPNLNEYVSSNSLVEINKLSTIGNNFKHNHTSQSSGDSLTVLSHGPGLTFEVNRAILSSLKYFFTNGLESDENYLPIPDALADIVKKLTGEDGILEEFKNSTLESVAEKFTDISNYESKIEVFNNDELSTVDPQHAKHGTTHIISGKNVVSTLLLDSKTVLLGTMDISNNSCELLKLSLLNGNHIVLRTFANMNVNNVRDMKFIVINNVKYIQLFLVNTCTNNITANNNNASIYLINVSDLENNQIAPTKITLKDESVVIDGDLEAMYYDEVNNKYLCSVSVVKPVLDLSNIFALDANGENVLDFKQIVSLAKNYKQGKVYTLDKNLLNVNASNVDVKLLLGSELELNNVSSYNINSTEDKLFFTSKSTPFETIFSFLVTLIPNAQFASVLTKDIKTMATQARNRFTLAYGIFLFRVLVSVSKLFLRFGTEFYSEKNELENIFTTIKSVLHPVKNLWDGAANQLYDFFIDVDQSNNATDISNVILNIDNGVFNKLFAGINSVYKEADLNNLEVNFEVTRGEEGLAIEGWVVDYKDPTLKTKFNPFQVDTSYVMLYKKKDIDADLFQELIKFYNIKLSDFELSIIDNPYGIPASELPKRYSFPYYHETMFARTIYHSSKLPTESVETEGGDGEGIAAFKFEWGGQRNYFKLLLSLDYYDDEDQSEDDGIFIKSYTYEDLEYNSPKEMEAALLSNAFISNMFKNFVPLKDLLLLEDTSGSNFSTFGSGAYKGLDIIFNDTSNVLGIIEGIKKVNYVYDDFTAKYNQVPEISGNGIKIDKDIIASLVLGKQMRQVPYLYYIVSGDQDDDNDKYLWTVSGQLEAAEKGITVAEGDLLTEEDKILLTEGLNYALENGYLIPQPITKTNYYFYNPDKYWSSTTQGQIIKAKVPQSKDNLYELRDVSNTVLKEMKASLRSAFNNYKRATKDLSNDEKITLYNVKIVPSDLLHFPLTIPILKAMIGMVLEVNENSADMISKLDDIWFTVLNSDLENANVSDAFEQYVKTSIIDIIYETLSKVYKEDPPVAVNYLWTASGEVYAAGVNIVVAEGDLLIDEDKTQLISTDPNFVENALENGHLIESVSWTADGVEALAEAVGVSVNLGDVLTVDLKALIIDEGFTINYLLAEKLLVPVAYYKWTQDGADYAAGEGYTVAEGDILSPEEKLFVIDEADSLSDAIQGGFIVALGEPPEPVPNFGEGIYDVNGGRNYLTNNGYNVYKDIAIGTKKSFKKILKDKVKDIMNILFKYKVTSSLSKDEEDIKDFALEIANSIMTEGFSIKDIFEEFDAFQNDEDLEEATQLPKFKPYLEGDLLENSVLPIGAKFLAVLFAKFEGYDLIIGSLDSIGIELEDEEADNFIEKIKNLLRSADVVKLGMKVLRLITQYLISAKNSPQDIFDILSDLVKHINPYRFTTKMLGIDGFNVLSLDKTNLCNALANTELENVFDVLIGDAKNFKHDKFNKKNLAFGSGLDNVFNVSAHGVDDVCGNNIIMGTTDMGSLVWNGLGNGITFVANSFLNDIAPILAEGDDDPSVQPLIKLLRSVVKNLKVRWGIMPMKLKVLLQSALLNQPKVFPANFNVDRRLHGHDVFVLHNNTVINKVTTSGFDNKLYINQKDLSYRTTSLNLLHKDGRSVLCCGTDKATFILNVNV